jgi:hypothetical protein
VKELRINFQACLPVFNDCLPFEDKIGINFIKNFKFSLVIDHYKKSVDMCKQYNNFVKFIVKNHKYSRNDEILKKFFYYYYSIGNRDKIYYPNICYYENNVEVLSISNLLNSFFLDSIEFNQEDNRIIEKIKFSSIPF